MIGLRDKENKVEVLYETDNSLRLRILPAKDEEGFYIIPESEFVPKMHWGKKIDNIDFEFLKEDHEHTEDDRSGV